MTNSHTWLIRNDVDDGWWRDWDEVNRESLGGHPLLDSRFVRLLCNHFAGGKLTYVQLRAPGRVLAQAVLERTAGGRWQAFCPSQAGVSAIVFAKDAPSWMALRDLLGRLPGFALALTLPYQDAPYSWVAEAQGALVQRVHLGTTMTVITDDFNAYWEARPKVMRDNLRRQMKRPAKEGMQVTLKQVTSGDAVEEAVNRYGDIESAGWKAKGGTAISRDNAQGKFYRELMSAYAASEGACVAELYFNDKLVASRFLVSGPGMHVVLKTTFDETMKNFAPGHSQLHLLMGELIAKNPGKAIEFYTKASKEWLQWATHSRPIESVTIYRFAALNKLAAWRRRRAETQSPEVAVAEPT